ncbi:MAG: GntR family transcriptional regulator [Trueperaceae bacterium]
MSSRVFAWLRNEILVGNIGSGERLAELDIAKRLGVSPTPVREAIRLLSGDGLVEYVDRKGVKVISLSEQEITKCFSVRNSLERLALKEAFPQMTAADKEQLMTLAEGTAEARGKPFGVLLEIDRNFHAFLVQRAQNLWLTEFTHRLSNALTVARLPLFKNPDITKVTEEHTAVADAVLENDLILADRLLDEHIKRVRHNAIELHRKIHPNGQGAPVARKGST